MSLTPYTLGGASDAPNTGTTLSFTLTHAVAAGDALVVALGTDSSGDPASSVADSQGNVWTLVKADTNQTDNQAVFVCLDAKAMTTSDTITGTWSGSGGSHTILGRGCNGIWTLGAVDVSISNDAASGTSPTSGASGTLKQSSEWAVAFLINGNAGGTPSAWTGGFTSRLTESATGNQFHTVADQTVSATTALTAGATITTTKWCMIMVTLRAGPYLAGSVASASGSTSQVLTLANNVTSGDASIVVLSTGSAAVTPSSVVDSASQTYTLVASSPTSNGECSYVYVKYNSTALTGGTSTVTVTWSGTANTKNMMVLGCNGLATSSAFDQASGVAGTSASPSSGATGALAQANEVAIGVFVAANAAGSITPASTLVKVGTTLHSGSGIYMAVGFLTTSSSAGVTASGTLGSSAAWTALVATFTPASGGSGGGGGGFQITTASPLTPDAVVGQAYSNTLQTANGVSPVTWAVTAGAVPTGMSLSTGITSGGTSAIANVMAVGGVDGQAGMDFSYYQNANSTIGPITGAKIFYSADLPASWTTKGSTSSADPTGTSPADIAGAGGIPIICWNGPGGGSSTQHSTPATITAFLRQVPAGQTVVFCWSGEPENPTSPFTKGSDYVSGFSATAQVIHGFGNPNLLTMHCGTWGPYGPTGRAYNGSFLPSGTDTDIYGLDIYQHQAGGSLYGATSWSTNGLSNNAFWTRYVALVTPLAAPLGRAMALSEYGVDVNTGSVANRNRRIQQDFSYLQGAFGPGGSVSTVPLFCWLYWWHTMAQANNDYKFTDAATIATWQGIANAAGGSGGSGGSGGAGGVLSGICNAAATYTFTAQATDSSSTPNVTTKSIQITVDAAGTLAITSTSPLQGGTISVPYQVQALASGGTPNYTWSVLSGSLPSGLSLDAPSGTISGTPNAAGTSTFTLKVTDSVSATASATFTITISSALDITTLSLASGVVNTAYSQTVSAANGTLPYAWGISGGALPDGLAIDAGLGTISGTPTAQGVFAFTVQVSDGGGATDTQDLTITISPASGGLPSPGRRVFGGAAGAGAVTFVGNALDRAPGVGLQYYNTFPGASGTQYTDFTDLSGNPISATVTADANGYPPQFKGPANVLVMYEDANNGAGPRRAVICDDIDSLILAIVTAVQGQVGT